ncbi:SNF2 family N-terminal domain-containing protein [Amanita rubescens]|nr:SNF2 family N-terminal domain-containing protein [Amanita rubescens]
MSPSRSADGESEYVEEADEDELMNEDEVEKRKAAEGQLQVKRQEVGKAKVADAVKRYSYLLGQTELFKRFMDRACDPEYAAILDSQPKPKGRGRKKAAHQQSAPKEGDEELLKAGELAAGGDDQPMLFEESPNYSLNGILADEMGLGKTLQTISFLAHPKDYCGISGLHLIIVPESTRQNWKREFERWTPDFNVVILTETKEERADLTANCILPQDFEVCITPYEICLIEKSALKKFSFEYIVIDEAHRIKNVDSILSQIVPSFNSRGRMLITGTPLRNSFQELFALLNFICPEIFVNYEDLDGFSHKDDSRTEAEEERARRLLTSSD